MSPANASQPKGAIYRCPVCGAEIVLLAPCAGCFQPHCCNQPMERRPRRARFFNCAQCGAEIAMISVGGMDPFNPRCCGQAMRQVT